MTPAINQAKKAGIDYQIHQYQHNPHAASYGKEAADLLGVRSSQVFKTLVLSFNQTQLAVAIVPVSSQLNLKAIAKALKTKKVTLANVAEAEKATGYIVGGISPLGQKKRLPMVLDNSAVEFETIYVSAGKRGLEIELSPHDLRQLCLAQLADIKDS